MNKKQKQVIGIILLIGIMAFVLSQQGLLPFSSSIPSNVKLAIPHFASYKCDVTQDVFGQTINVPKSGALISRSTVGYYTNGIKNVEAEVSNALWSYWIGFNVRVKYAVCDKNGYNCGSYSTSTYSSWGTKQLSISSIDFDRESLRVYFQRGALGIYYNIDGGKVSFDAKKFGLTLYSTTQDPAGRIICSTSCDLSCPDIGYRKDLVFDCNGNDDCENRGEDGFDTSDILDFYDTAPYLEYWETIDYDINQQGGANIYDSSRNTFCFAGVTYSASTINIGGTTYIYPDTNKRQYKQCCPGAVISSTYSDKVCQNDGTWKTIQDTDKLTCISDINCPNSGNNVCQNKQLSGYSCVNKDSNGVGICEKESGTSVECCINNDCNRDQVCDSSHTCKGGSPLPTCGDGVVDSGEQCDDGNNIGGDGCSSICESEISCNVDSDCDEGQKCDGGKCISSSKCGSCDDYVVSKVLGSLWKEKQCETTILQNITGCLTSWIKIGVVFIIILFGILSGFDIFYSFLKGKVNEKNRRIYSWIFSIGVSSILGYILFQILSSPSFIIIGIVFIAGLLIIKTTIGGKVSHFRKEIGRLRR